jgi:DNA-binding GntR family transcriptional regulator
MKITMHNTKEKGLVRNTLSDQVLDQLMDWISNGELKMGDKLNADLLAKRLGVSRMPVREALASLEKMGLAETKPYIGTRLVVLTKEDIIEIYLIRMSLEPIAAKAACRKITDEQVNNLSEIHSRYKEVVEKDIVDPMELYTINREFHFSIYKLSGLQRVCDIIESLWDNLSFFKLIYGQKLLDNAKSKNAMITEHESYLNALKERDGDRLFKMLGTNIQKRTADIEYYRSGFFEDDEKKYSEQHK